jgi:hypothetical protein
MALGGWGIPPPLASPLYSGGTAENMLLGEKERQGSIKTLEVHEKNTNNKQDGSHRWTPWPGLPDHDPFIYLFGYNPSGPFASGGNIGTAYF